MHTPLRAHTASMRLCVSLCLHPSLPASHATHTHRVSLQEGVWLHAGERVRRRWPLRGRPSAVRQVSDGRRSHCVTHTHTPSLPGRVRTVEVWRKVRTVCARASGVWPCMHAQACRGLRVCVVPSQVPLPRLSLVFAPLPVRHRATQARVAWQGGVSTHTPLPVRYALFRCAVSHREGCLNTPLPVRYALTKYAVPHRKGACVCVCVCVCLCLAAAASGPAT
jgi:hypothetical protein